MRPRHCLAILAILCFALSGGCTTALWESVSRRELIFPQVVGVDRSRTIRPAGDVLVVQYKTSVDEGVTDPQFAVGVPLDDAGDPLPPFAVGPGEPPPTMMPLTSAAPTSAPTTSVALGTPASLTPGDFQAGRAAREAKTFIPCGAASGISRGGTELSDMTTTWTDYFVVERGGRRSVHWLRLPRHVGRPSDPNPLQIVAVVALTPITLTWDLISQPIGGLLFPFASSASR